MRTCMQRGCALSAAGNSPFCEVAHHNMPDGEPRELPGSSLNPGYVVDAEFQAQSRLGRKDDGGKPRYDLLPWRGLILVAMVMTHGAKKYAPDNWRKVEGWRWRYFRAAVGHLIAWWGGEKLDPEWGLPHLAHAACCVLFLLELDHCTDVHVDTKSTDQ